MMKENSESSEQLVGLVEDLDAAVAQLIEGMMVDGAHHKQYAMSEAVRLICGQKFLDEAINEFGFDLGVPS